MPAKVKFYMRRHRLPTMAEVRGGMQLADASLYEEKLMGKFDQTRSERVRRCSHLRRTSRVRGGLE